MAEGGPRQNTVYKAMNRPLTVLGAERRLFFVALIAGGSVFSLMHSLVGGIVLFVVGVIIARIATKHDVEILRVLFNSGKFRRRYDPMKADPIPLAFNLRGRDGGAMPEASDAASIRSASGGSSNSYVAFSAKDYGADVDEIAPTLRGMGHESSHANGGGQVAVAFTLHGSDGTASTATPTDVAGSVRTKPPGSIENSSTTIAQQGMAVRRLTPRECERLQGFPDDYTQVEYRGKLAADGPRYRALGNSMAVPVMRWIGQRIAAVHEIVSRRSS